MVAEHAAKQKVSWSLELEHSGTRTSNIVRYSVYRTEFCAGVFWEVGDHPKILSSVKVLLLFPIGCMNGKGPTVVLEVGMFLRLMLMAFMFQIKILMREGGLHYSLCHYFLKQNSPLFSL